MVKLVGNNFKLIVIIVNKNLSRRVIKACKKAGLEGATAFPARGTGTHNAGSIFGVEVEEKKDIVLCLTPTNLVDKVISKVRAAARLDRPGTGIAFVVNSKNICGIAHKLNSNNFSNTKS
ncbi:MAG: P-II family nitrogen regulator [Candidatus Paceibacterota bacterium]